MAYRTITAANADQIPVGSKVWFSYGVLHGGEYGHVTGKRIGRFGVTLTAVTEAGEIQDISGISNIGIGAYLVDKTLAAAFLGES